MTFTLSRLLENQRGLYDLPRGMDRFRRYLHEMTGGTDDIVAPLVELNPIGKPHVAEAYDRLIALDAESIAAAALREAELRLVHVEGELSVALIVADAAGGWTDRHLTEFRHRFDDEGMRKRGWTTVMFWADEVPTVESVRAETLATAYRSAHVGRFGWPESLRDRMNQEGRAAAFAGQTEPSLEPDDLEYSRGIIQPYLGATDVPTVVSCLYGDEAAKSVGFAPMGLSSRAGYATGLADASDGPPPEDVLRTTPDPKE